MFNNKYLDKALVNSTAGAPVINKYVNKIRANPTSATIGPKVGTSVVKASGGGILSKIVSSGALKKIGIGAGVIGAGMLAHKALSNKNDQQYQYQNY